MVFTEPKFTVFSDMMKLMKIVDEFPNTFSFWRMTAKHTASAPAPDVVGINLFGNPYLFFQSADCLRDLYVNQNQFVTKSFLSRLQFHQLMKSSIVFQATEDP